MNIREVYMKQERRKGGRIDEDKGEKSEGERDKWRGKNLLSPSSFILDLPMNVTSNF
jgi:hypothetical protein